MPNFFLSHKRAKVAGRMARPFRLVGGRVAPDLKQTRRDPAQGPPDSAMRLVRWTKSENARGVGRCRSDWAMKLFTGWIMSAGLVFSAAAANAQVLAPHESGRPPYSRVSDVEGPYAAIPPEAPVLRYGPTLLPAQEVYAIVRESGFSPLGIPQQRGLVYTIAVIDRRGDDGRLVIDARTGRIIRFMPAYRMGDNFNDDMTVTYGPVGALPPGSRIRGAPRPRPAKKSPLPARPAPEPAQQSAAVQAKPADAQAAAPQAAAPPVVEAKPAAPQIQPTQEMPKVQGLE